MARTPLVLLCAMICQIGCASTEPGDVSSVALPSGAMSRAGNVYLLRGFIGIFSAGIDRLGSEIKSAGVRATVFQDDKWALVCRAFARREVMSRYHEPLVLIGHSYGADDAI